MWKTNFDRYLEDYITQGVVSKGQQDTLGLLGGQPATSQPNQPPISTGRAPAASGGAPPVGASSGLARARSPGPGQQQQQQPQAARGGAVVGAPGAVARPPPLNVQQPEITYIKVCVRACSCSSVDIGGREHSLVLTLNFAAAM